MIIDAFTFNDEYDMLEFRLRYLYDIVDKFVLVEADITHSGKKKMLNFFNNKDLFGFALNKIVYHPVQINTEGLNFSYKPERYEADAPQWQVECQQRNAILDGCEQFSDDDILMISDCDEIPSVQAIEYRKNNHIPNPVACDQRLVPLYLNYLNVDTSWRGTIMCQMKDAREHGVQPIRDIRNKLPALPDGGWHLTFFGGASDIKRKIESYAHQENNRPEITQEYIQHCLDNRLDFFTGEKNNLKKIGKDFYPPEFLRYVKKEWWYESV